LRDARCALMLDAMNRLLIVLGLLALGAGAVFLWQSTASRADGDPTPPAPSNGVAPVADQPSTDAAGTTARATDPRAQNPTSLPPSSKGAPDLFTRRGRVVDPSGNGVAGLSVAVVHRPVEFGGPMADSGRFVARTVTDADGRFAVSLQGANGRPSVEWVGPLNAPTAPPFLGLPQQVTFDPKLTDVELELRVVPGTTIEGHVRLDAVSGERSDEVRLMAIGQQTGHSAYGRIDATGHFVLELLHDPTYLVVASVSHAVSPVALDVRTGTKDLELTLLPVGAVSVEVEGGTPAGLRVECSRIGGEPAELARMGISGRSPQFLLPGAYSIAVYTQTHYAFATVDSVGTREAPWVIPVRLEPAALVDVKNEADGPRIVVVENAGRIVRAQSIPLAGRTSLSVPPGAFAVREHSLDGTLVESHPVALGPNASLQIVFAAPPR